MKILSFKRYLREAEDKDSFNSFVEDVFDGKWNVAIKNFGNYTDKFNVKDTAEIYRIVFFKKEEINQLTSATDLKQKVSGLLTTENQGHPRFYTKDDYHNIPDQLSFLSSIGEKIHGYTDDSAEQLYMGIIISQKIGANDNVDFSNYKNGNSEIKKRIDRTKPVLAVNATDFRIVANMEFDNQGDGWTVKEFNSRDFKPEGDEEEIESDEIEETPDEELEKEKQNEIK